MSNRSITRRAILIGAAGTPGTEEFLHGVAADLVAMQNHLRSERGGFFFDKEIVVLQNPTIHAVREEIISSQVDYLIIHFSGHGYTDSRNGCRMINLKDGVLCDTDLWSLNTPRQLMLIDACRNHYTPVINGLPKREKQYLNFTGSRYRSYFDEAIQSSPPGRLLIHGTRHGMSAQEFHSRAGQGGYFTQALLRVAQAPVQGVRQAIGAHHLVREVNQQLNHLSRYQQAEVVSSEGDLRVPFAIREQVDVAVARVPRPLIPQPIPKPTSAAGPALLVTAVALILVAAASR